MAAYSDIQNLSAYFRHSTQFFYIITDVKGTLIYSNPLFRNLCNDFADEKKYQHAIQQGLKKPLTPFTAELEIKSKTNSLFTIRWEFFVNNDDDANVSCIQGIGIAINESKKQQPNNNQFIQDVIDRQEKERQKIGNELHDNINQHLSSTRLYLEVVRDKVTGENFKIIDSAHKDLSAVIKEIRRLSQSLAAPDLYDIGLVESIKDTGDLLQTTHGFSVNFSHKHFRENSLPVDLKLALFRIIQEQLNNIIAHANADRIEIRLQSDAEFIFLFIWDNGTGLDLHDLKKGPGLTGIINTASLFGGQVEIQTAPGEGFSIFVSIPAMNVELPEMN